MAECFPVYVDHIFFIHSSVNGQLGCFHILAIVKMLLMNIRVQISFWILLLKCFPQYVSKFGRLNSGHRTRKGQFSFQSQGRAMPKNIQTTIQLYSFHMLARFYWKSFKLNFNSLWNKNFQAYNLGFKEAEELQIKLPIFIGSRRKQEHYRSTSAFISLTTWKPLTHSVDHNKLWKIMKQMGVPRPLTCFLRNLCRCQEATVKIGHAIPKWFQIRKGVGQGCVLSPCLFNLPGWMNHNLESRLLREISAILDMQMIPL